MELQEKFKVLLEEHTYNDTLKWTQEYTAKECTKLCLEEQLNLLSLFLDESDNNPYVIVVQIEQNKIFSKLVNLQQQLKSLA